MIKLVNPFWDADKRKWIVRNIDLNLPIFKKAYINDECVFNIIERKELSKSSFTKEDCVTSIQKFTKQLYYLNYSGRTIRSYEYQITTFLEFFSSDLAIFENKDSGTKFFQILPESTYKRDQTIFQLYPQSQV
jgi:hypothetical protein